MQLFCFFTLALLSRNAVSSAIIQEPKKDVPEITYLHIKSEVRMRFATTQVLSRMINNKNHSTEAVFNVILPNKAFISNFSLEMDGVVYPGQVQEKHKDDKDFETAKKKGLSAGHVTQKPRDTNRFLVTINVAPHSEVKFDLRYQQLLQRRLGFYEHPIHVNPGQPVKDVSIEVFIEESKKISFVRVPPLRPVDPSLPAIETVHDIRIERPTPLSAHLFYTPSNKDEVVNGAFIVEYEVDRKYDSGEIVAVNGYFVHFFAPEGLKPLPKDILFILDTSNSMVGKKIKQVRAAMKQILKDLNTGDRFNLLRFARKLDFWRPDMQKWNSANMNEALGWISHLDARSITDINGALVAGLEMMSRTRDSTNETRTTIVVFLTDGEATEGETNKNNILTNVDEINKYGIPVFGLSFGADADFDLMRKLSLRNNAIARRIYEASDTSLQLKHFYDEISAALIADLKFTYLDNQVDNSTLTNRNFQNYFNGTEVVIAGKLSDNSSTISLEVGGNTEKGALGKIKPVESINIKNSSQGIGLMSYEDIEKLPEKLWAYLTIKQLDDKRIASTNQTEKEKLSERMLELSLKYKFVTPVTSMLIVKPPKPTERPVETTTSPGVKTTVGPGAKPTVEPGSQPTVVPGSQPTVVPGSQPTVVPGSQPTVVPGSQPTVEPGVKPSVEPGVKSSVEPGEVPHPKPSSDASPDGATVPTSAESKEPNVISETSDSDTDKEIISGGVYGDPHFLVSIQGLSVPVCFHILGKKGDIINLVSDKKKGVYIRSEIMEGATNYQNNPWMKTFMRRIVIQTWWVTLDINPERIVYNGRIYPWRKENAVLNRVINMVVNGRGRDLLINLGKGQQFHIKRSTAGKADKRVKYLDLYLLDGTGLSTDTSGVLGQLIHVKGRLKQCGKNRKGQTVGKLLIKGGIYSRKKPRLVHAVLNLQQFSLSPDPVSCWIIRDGLRDLVKGHHFSKTISPTIKEK